MRAGEGADVNIKLHTHIYMYIYIFEERCVVFVFGAWARSGENEYKEDVDGRKCDESLRKTIAAAAICGARV